MTICLQRIKLNGLWRMFGLVLVLHFSISILVGKTLTFETSDHQLNIPEGAQSQPITIRFINASDGEIKLVSAVSTCPCLSGSNPGRIFASGERGELSFVAAVAGMSGRQTAIIRVTTEAQGKQESFEMSIVLQAPIAINATPRMTAWYLGDENSPKAINLFVNESLGLTLTAIECKNPEFSVDVSKEAGGHYIVHVRVASTAKQAKAEIVAKFSERKDGMEQQARNYSMFAYVWPYAKK